MRLRIPDLKLRAKIFSLVAIMIVGLAFFAIVSFDTLNTVKVSGPLYKGIVENKDLVADILPPPEYLVEAHLLVLQMLDEQDKSKLDLLLQRSAELGKEYETRHQHWKETLAPGLLREAMVVRSYKPARRFLDLRDKQFIPAILRGDITRARELAQGELKKSYDEHRAWIDKVVALANEKTEADEKTARSMIGQRTIMQLILAFVVVVVSSVAAYLLTRYITRTVHAYLSFAGQVAEGNLTARLQPKSKDELGLLGGHLNSMAQNLNDMAEEIRRSTHQMASSTAEVLVIGQQLSASTSKTSSAVIETISTIEQVKLSAKSVSEKAKKVAESAVEAVEISDTGRKATEDSIHRTNLIKEQMESIGETVVRLSDQSSAIEKIISSVQDLADQSNLLAVNASIEAARAGDRGKGFAVVAHEIKDLADQSKQATDQVRVILEDIRKWVSAVVMATEQGSKAVEAGVVQSRLAGDAIQSLAESVAVSSQITSTIHAASEQQFTGVDQVSAAMGNIETAMQQNVTGAKALEVSGKKLEELGSVLHGLIARYKTDAALLK
jgi:methyl-accepting chemotaxis protein